MLGPLIANILLTAMTISDDDKRHAFLAANPVIVRRHGMTHRIAGFERRSATWMTFCGVSYEGNAYEENAEEGTVDCMTCMVARG
jgi:hypothetical protein